MTPLERIRSVIPDYGGYADESSRRKSDELIRSYVGERLTRRGGDGSSYDALLARCEFADHAALAEFEHCGADEPRVAALEEVDAKILALADDLSGGDFDGTVTKLAAAFDQRSAAMRA